MAPPRSGSHYETESTGPESLGELSKMRFSIDNPDATPAFLEYLSSWSDVIYEQISDDEVEVSLLGSYRTEAMEEELTMRVRAWADAQRARGLTVGVF
jgi:hypothetical protein